MYCVCITCAKVQHYGFNTIFIYWDLKSLIKRVCDILFFIVEL